MDINPNATRTWTPESGSCTYTMRPLTLEEEHRIFDLQASEGIWATRLYLLRTCLVSIAPTDGDQVELEGLESAEVDAALKAIPITHRVAICDEILAGVALSEDELGK
jgi:hypothetical protein